MLYQLSLLNQHLDNVAYNIFNSRTVARLRASFCSIHTFKLHWCIQLESKYSSG